MVRHAPIHRRSGHSDIAICCGRNVRGSSPSTSVVPLSNQVTTLNHKRFKGFKMFSDGHSDPSCETARGHRTPRSELEAVGTEFCTRTTARLIVTKEPPSSANQPGHRISPSCALALAREPGGMCE